MIDRQNCASRSVRGTAIQIIALSINYTEQLHRIIPCRPASAINGKEKRKEKIHDIFFPYLASLIVFETYLTAVERRSPEFFPPTLVSSGKHRKNTRKLSHLSPIYSRGRGIRQLSATCTENETTDETETLKLRKRDTLWTHHTHSCILLVARFREIEPR